MRLTRIQGRWLPCVGVLCACLLACHHLHLSTTVSRQLEHQQKVQTTLDGHALALARLPAQQQGLQAGLDELRRSLATLERRVQAKAVSRNPGPAAVPTKAAAVPTKLLQAPASGVASPVPDRQAASPRHGASLAVLLLLDGHADLNQAVAAVHPALAQAPGVGLYAISREQHESTVQMSGLEVMLLPAMLSPAWALDHATDEGVLGGDLRQAMRALAAKGHERVVLVRSGCVLAADAIGFFDEALSYASQDRTVWGVLGYNHNGHLPGGPDRLFRTEYMEPLVWGMNIERWGHMVASSWHNSTSAGWASWLRSARQGNVALAPEVSRARCSWRPRDRLPPVRMSTSKHHLVRPPTMAEYNSELFRQLQSGRIQRVPYSSKKGFQDVARTLGADSRSIGGSPSMGYMGMVVLDRGHVGGSPTSKVFIHPSGVKNVASLFV